MVAHRFWRAIGLRAYGEGELSLSEFHLLAGTTRVDGAAALTSSVMPTAGSLSYLKDDDTSTAATWSREDGMSLILTWDFGLGGDQDVTDIRVGAAADPAKFLLGTRTQWSDDGTNWTDSYAYGGLLWPGAGSKTTSTPRGIWNKYDTSNGGWTIDASGKVITPAGGTSGGARALPSASNGVRQFELVVTGDMRVLLGVATRAASISPVGADASGWVYVAGPSSAKFSQGVTASYGSVAITGDVIGVVVDFTAGTLTFYKNGVSMGVAFSGLAGELYPAVGVNNVSARTYTLRTGGFAFPVAGAQAWDDTLGAVTGVVGRPQVQDSLPTGASAPKAYGVSRPQVPLRARPDFQLGVWGEGIGRVRGATLDYVAPTNRPYKCLVRLIREVDGLQVREAWSAPDGTYDFQYIDELQSYTVAAYYLAHGKRAVISDGLTLANGKVELMS